MQQAGQRDRQAIRTALNCVLLYLQNCLAAHELPAQLRRAQQVTLATLTSNMSSCVKIIRICARQAVTTRLYKVQLRVCL